MAERGDARSSVKTRGSGCRIIRAERREQSVFALRRASRLVTQRLLGGSRRGGERGKLGQREEGSIIGEKKPPGKHSLSCLPFWPHQVSGMQGGGGRNTRAHPQTHTLAVRGYKETFRRALGRHPERFGR